MSNETILRLAEIPNIIAVKDATGNIARGLDLLNRIPEGFQVFSGDDPTAVSLILAGASGNITVVGNVAPKKMHLMCQAALRGDVASAVRLSRELLPLSQKLFVEANPIPVKWALSQMGIVPPGIRLPLVPLSVGCKETVREAMQAGGIQI